MILNNLEMRFQRFVKKPLSTGPGRAGDLGVGAVPVARNGGDQKVVAPDLERVLVPESRSALTTAAARALDSHKARALAPSGEPGILAQGRGGLSHPCGYTCHQAAGCPGIRLVEGTDQGIRVV